MILLHLPAGVVAALADVPCVLLIGLAISDASSVEANPSTVKKCSSDDFSRVFHFLQIPNPNSFIFYTVETT